MSEQPKCLKLTQLNSVTIISFRDSSILDAITTQRVGRELYELVESGDRKKIVLDFEHVRFLSSQTLGVLLTLRRKADKAGVTIALAAIRPELRRVFEITNLDKLFNFFESPQKAAESFGEA
jgi:anti-sigma B factor antagonist